MAQPSTEEHKGEQMKTIEDAMIEKQPATKEKNCLRCYQCENGHCDQYDHTDKCRLNAGYSQGDATCFVKKIDI